MKSAYMKKYLDDKEMVDFETPHVEGIEATCEQLEDGELMAEALKDLVSEKEARRDDFFTPQWQQDGSMKFRCKKNQVPPPSETEGFRHRMRLWGLSGQ